MSVNFRYLDDVTTRQTLPLVGPRSKRFYPAGILKPRFEMIIDFNRSFKQR